MLSIPLPFVVSLLLAILAAVIYVRQEAEEKPAFVFLTVCAITTIIVGLRWTVDTPLFRSLQPMLASCIPVIAWYCFSRAHRARKFHFAHAIAPVVMVFWSLTYPFWQPPIDPFLTLLYMGYGLALIRASIKKEDLPEDIRLSDIDRALKAERIAGCMLIFSAALDGALAIDFTFFAGKQAVYILTIGHAILLPVLAVAVVMVSMSIRRDTPITEPPTQAVESQEEKTSTNVMDDKEAKDILKVVDELMKNKEVYLDPDLTLNRLSRKACIPARKISSAINQIYGRNVSQVINGYRIERAKQLLKETDDPITQIYLNSGFQTKSNFNREFTRVTKQTPSAYRQGQGVR